MLDRERILAKIDEFGNYLKEIIQVLPDDFEEYEKIEKKRSCERLLQLCIECLIDMCKLFVSGLKLGLPNEENDVFDKLTKNGIIKESTSALLKQMRGLRNILIHEYTTIDDKIIYGILKSRLQDLNVIKKEILIALRKKSN